MKHFVCLMVFLITGVSRSWCLEKEMTINVAAGHEDCFYQKAQAGEIIDVEYQVIDGGHGDLDISFTMADPTGRIIAADFKKSENNHRADALQEGDYRFCFDNKFSSFNTKTVFFELIIDKNTEIDWEDDQDYHFDVTEGAFAISVEEVQTIIGNVRNHLNKVQHLQDLIKSAEARDRNVAEENYFKVNSFSLFQIVVMMAVGIVQVIMVRSLFDDRSTIHKIWKNLDNRR